MIENKNCIGNMNGCSLYITLMGLGTFHDRNLILESMLETVS